MSELFKCDDYRNRITATIHQVQASGIKVTVPVNREMLKAYGFFGEQIEAEICER